MSEINVAPQHDREQTNYLEAFHTLEYACGAVEEELGS
jgi:hypothetical protein